MCRAFLLALRARSLKALALEFSPREISPQVLPGALQAPQHLELAIREMLKKAAAHQPCYVFPIVISLIRKLLLQDRANGDHRRKGIAENQKLKKELAAQNAEPRCQQDGQNATQFNHRSKKFK